MSRGYSVPKRAISLDPANKEYSAYMSPTRFDYVNSNSGDKYFRTAYDNAAAGKKMLVRNQIAKEMAALIDENHDIYHESLRRNMTGTNIISDFVTLGLTSAAAISTGAHATKALAALGTGAKGFGGTINSHILQQQTLSAILKASRVKKNRIYGEMQTKFDKSPEIYTLEDVIRDLGQYWQAGLLTGALEELDQMTSAKNNQIDNAKAQTAGSTEKAQGQAVMNAANLE